MVGKNNRELVSIKIAAEVESLEQIKELFNGTEKGSTVQFCGGSAEIELLSAGDTLSFSGGTEVQLLLSIPLGVACGVIGNWLYDALFRSTRKLELNGRRTRITAENITQAIETIQELVRLSQEKDSSYQDMNAQDELSTSEESNTQE